MEPSGSNDVLLRANYAPSWWRRVGCDEYLDALDAANQGDLMRLQVHRRLHGRTNVLIGSLAIEEVDVDALGRAGVAVPHHVCEHR